MKLKSNNVRPIIETYFEKVTTEVGIETFEKWSIWIYNMTH